MSEPTCVVVSSGGNYSGAQGFDYFEGISARTAGSRGLCMALWLVLPIVLGSWRVARGDVR